LISNMWRRNRDTEIMAVVGQIELIEKGLTKERSFRLRIENAN